MISRFLLLHFLLQPMLKAFKMDKTDAAIAFARVKQWVCVRLLVAPTYLALDIIVLGGVNDTAIYLYGFF